MSAAFSKPIMIPPDAHQLFTQINHATPNSYCPRMKVEELVSLGETWGITECLCPRIVPPDVIEFGVDVELPEIRLNHLTRFLSNLPVLVAISSIGLLLSWGAWVGSDQADDRAQEEDLYLNVLQMQPKTCPPAVKPAGAQLPDDAPVIGIRIGKRARAYALSAFSNVRDHVLNDLLGGAALTVTHCPKTGCTRVFADSERGRPLAIAVGGWAGNRGDEPDQNSVLLLEINGVRYYQDTGKALAASGSIPYAEADFDRTTWGEWRRTHPETDVVPGPALGQ